MIATVCMFVQSQSDTFFKSFFPIYQGPLLFKMAKCVCFKKCGTLKMDVACSSHSQLLCIQLKHFRNSLIISLSCSLLMRPTQRPNNPFKRWPSLTPDPPPPAAPQPRLPVNLRVEHPVIECTWDQMWCLMYIYIYICIIYIWSIYIFIYLFIYM